MFIFTEYIVLQLAALQNNELQRYLSRLLITNVECYLLSYDGIMIFYYNFMNDLGEITKMYKGSGGEIGLIPSS